MCTTDRLKLVKKTLMQLIEEKHKLISYRKPKETMKMSKCWDHFSQIYVDNVKQDFVMVVNPYWFINQLQAQVVC